MSRDDGSSTRVRWARLRFSIIGALLAAPPKRGELRHQLEELAKRTWKHPTTGAPTTFAASTIERWLYLARHGDHDPVSALVRKTHAQAGKRPSMPLPLRAALRGQYKTHRRWSYKLHYDNLIALAEQRGDLGKVPSYATVTRFMKEEGLVKRRRKPRRQDDEGGGFAAREQRSYEAEYVHGLWHSDFHTGSRRVLTKSGEYERVYLLAVIDDHSRLCCHLQWYLAESTEAFVHGLSQAILKRGLPRSLMTDNGSAMTAAETTEGLDRLGIEPKTTLENTPEQNAKVEAFWAPVEGRLMAMLEGYKELTLPLLNRATIAWAEQEYQRHHHSEIHTTPLARYLDAPNVGRPSPDADTLRHLFRKQDSRTQRRSDGTLSVGGVRFELPARYRTLHKIAVRFARWDLSSIDLVDARSDKILCALYPLDKQANADGRRRVLEPLDTDEEPAPSGIAPHLIKLMAEYGESGLPPAYLPLGDDDIPDDDSDS